MGLCRINSQQYISEKSTELDTAVGKNDLQTVQNLMIEINKDRCHLPRQVFANLKPASYDAIQLKPLLELPNGLIEPEALIFGPQS